MGLALEGRGRACGDDLAGLVQAGVPLAAAHHTHRRSDPMDEDVLGDGRHEPQGDDPQGCGGAVAASEGEAQDAEEDAVGVQGRLHLVDAAEAGGVQLELVGLEQCPVVGAAVLANCPECFLPSGHVCHHQGLGRVSLLFGLFASCLFSLLLHLRHRLAVLGAKRLEGVVQAVRGEEGQQALAEELDGKLLGACNLDVGVHVAEHGKHLGLAGVEPAAEHDRGLSAVAVDGHGLGTSESAAPDLEA
mmetsp:Transcript_59262/g.170184  ORF Transcript_59262/g.170184 Transcript_59262/m.170184 type:complete len:246 (+) Transcript_59262:554-1291(+)